MSLTAAPGWASGTPAAFDPAAEAQRQGVHALGYCKSALLVETGGPAGGSWLARAAALPGGGLMESTWAYRAPEAWDDGASETVHLDVYAFGDEDDDDL